MRRLIALVGLLLASMHSASAAADGGLPPIVVYAPSPCLSCIDWADHLRKSGFEVTMTETLVANMPRLKRWLNVPSELESVHTAKVAGYFIEGHVPAEDIIQLLKEKPTARGLAVPGLPRGAPGRELSNPVCETACTILDNAGQERDIRRERYDTLLVAPDGKTSIFARH
ncbi:MAG: metal-binding protein [Rhodocyclales bacterium RIFCSPLOWO2_02_FULL_63_24]|nr:MAG: metal-binding protein [Rhodocyclales bacterium GWA2_65_19]OHC72098.1 MAG: metal-binding protein [Rhodocyclales bacterium RIFCSPLOWO2_02_FULL_63_24]